MHVHVPFCSLLVSNRVFASLNITVVEYNVRCSEFDFLFCAVNMYH